jgi:hypothetical protein
MSLACSTSCGTNQNGIYEHFRGAAPICGTVTKPTGRKDECVALSGVYPVRWHETGMDIRYTCIAAAPVAAGNSAANADALGSRSQRVARTARRV